MKLYYFYTLKTLWDSQGKIRMYYGMSRVKKQLSGKRSIKDMKGQLYWWNKIPLRTKCEKSQWKRSHISHMEKDTVDKEHLNITHTNRIEKYYSCYGLRSCDKRITLTRNLFHLISLFNEFILSWRFYIAYTLTEHFNSY